MDKTIVIAVAIIVFFAGFGVGSVVFYNQPSTPILGHGMEGPMASPETMNQMMQDPELRQEWLNWMAQDPEHMNQMMQDKNFRNEMMDFMVQDSEHMRQWMLEDPDHVPMMIEEMRTNHDFMMGMAMPMIKDPDIRLQMIGHMTENPEAMAEMQQMMSSGMMGQGMMEGHMMSNYATQTQEIPTGNATQRTIDISLEEVEFWAEVESEGGEEEIAFVELHRWEPNLIIVNQGDEVTLNISNPRKHAHTFSIPDFGVNTEILEPREGKQTITFVADTAGVFTFYCGLPYNADRGYCDPDHSMMTGTLIVLE